MFKQFTPPLITIGIGNDAIGNTLEMKFVLIEPGTFMMGSPESAVDRYDSETQHRVTLQHFIPWTLALE